MAQDGARLVGATVRIGDGLNTGRSTLTNSSGEYRLDDLAAGTGSVSAVADGFDSVITSRYIDGAKPLDFTLRTSVPWSQAGTGSAVVDMPRHIRAVHVIGSYTGVRSNFIVRVGQCVIIEDQLGTGASRTMSEGTYPVTPALTPSSGIVEIIVSSIRQTSHGPSQRTESRAEGSVLDIESGLKRRFDPDNVFHVNQNIAP